MFRLILVSTVIALTAGASPRVRPIVPMLDKGIVGGENADIKEFPHHLSLEVYGVHICGASVLSSTRALSAAHCTDGVSTPSLSIRAGSSYQGQGGQVVQVRKFAQHPKYNRKTIDYDVSLLALALPLQFGDTVAPISLHPVGEELNIGVLATVTGWGTPLPGSSLPPALQKLQLPKVSDSYCKGAYGSGAITTRMTCHGYEQGGKDTCQGDSGGPLVVKNIQVGVVSWGAGCASAGYPGVYAKVANSEIQEHINNNL